MDDETLRQAADAIERIIHLARAIDFDLMHGRVEPVARLVSEVRYFVDVTATSDSFEAGQALHQELRHRRGLPDT